MNFPVPAQQLQVASKLIGQSFEIENSLNNSFLDIDDTQKAYQEIYCQLKRRIAELLDRDLEQLLQRLKI